MTIHRIDDLVSPAWTAEEALHICDLLESLRDVIWRVHSRAIHAHLEHLDLRAAFEAERPLDV